MVFRSTTLLLGLALLIAAAWAEPARTQAPPQESGLLTEVRLLRQAIEALAGNGSRIQVVFGRLQLQEQRTTTAVRRVTEARSALASHAVSLSAVQNRLNELDTSVSTTNPLGEELRAIQDSIAHYRRESARLEAERVRLATEESDATQMLALEQGRWSDLNRQLEELERVLMQQK